MKTINDLDFGVPKEIEKYTAHSAEIGIMINNYIQSQKGMNKKSFAKLVGKTASDITRWVSGSHNFTILTLSLIETHTDMSIVKKLSSGNIKDHINCNVFKIETEKDLKLEIRKLKHKVRELEKHAEILNLKENTWSTVKTTGIYDADSIPNIHDMILLGSEKSTFNWSGKDARRIRSKGSALSVRKAKLVNVNSF
jgi:hypothetical protein